MHIGRQFLRWGKASYISMTIDNATKYVLNWKCTKLTRIQIIIVHFQKSNDILIEFTLVNISRHASMGHRIATKMDTYSSLKWAQVSELTLSSHWNVKNTVGWSKCIQEFILVYQYTNWGAKVHTILNCDFDDMWLMVLVEPNLIKDWSIPPTQFLQLWVRPQHK